MKSERLQVLIEVGQRERLERTAVQRGVSVAALVREAIDVVYPAEAGLRVSVAADILAAEPMDVPDLDALLGELADLRGRRG